MNKKKKILSEYFIMDFLLLVGILLILVTTFLINVYAGLYLTGISLIILSVFLSKTEKKEEEKR